ncbi:hypothetical protein C8R46DRAFT_1125660 [Mycena filopes]|nr:hypothetical protein C8R46DRAFT_1125660 [Mycena filopes]
MTAPFALPMHLFPLDFTRRRIAEIDAEILALKDALSKAKLERKALKQHLASYIYPVLTLPNEVVSEIFLQTLDKSPSLGGRASPIYLGHICQRWRDIALSTPSLWSTMDIAMRHFKAPQNYLRLLDVWLTRSRHCPLSVTFTDVFNGRVWIMPRIMEAILAHQARWETIEFNTSWDVLPDIQTALPLLGRLDIYLMAFQESTHSSAGMAGSAKTLFGPHLTTVALYGMKADMVRLPWTQLTSITIGAPLGRIAKILRSATNLRELSVSAHRDGDNGGHSHSIPALMHLQSLRFVSGTSEGQVALSSRLTLPGLKELHLQAVCIPEVVELLTRSQCPLEGLYIRMAEVEYLPFLQVDGTIALEACANEEGSDESGESDSDSEY